MGADTFHWRSKFKPLIEKQAQLEKKKEKQESYPLIVPNVDIEPQVNYHNLGTNLRAVTHARRGDIVQVVGSSGLVMNMTAEEDILMGDQLELFETSPLTVHVKRIQLDFSHLEAATIRNIRFGYGYHDMSNSRVGAVPLRNATEVAFDFAPYSLSDGLDHHQYWITQHESGLSPSTLQQAMWIREYLRPKYIKWDMMKILEKKCWRCQHWEQNVGHLDSWLCNIQHYQQYDAWTNENKFPEMVYFSKIKKKYIIEQEDYIICNNSIVNSNAETIDLQSCPCYTESQEYHDWKEQQPILKIKDTMISL